MNDQVSMLPYGHRSIREDMFFKSIMNEPDWGADDLGESEQESGQQAQESGQRAQECRQRAQESGQHAQENGQRAQESWQHAKDSSQQVKNKNHQKHKRQTQQSANVPQINSALNTSLNSNPDPGYHLRNYSEDELNQNLVDFDNLSEFLDSGSSTDAACDGFILSQAIEDSDKQPPTSNHN